MQFVTGSDIDAAAQRIRPHITRTQLVAVPGLAGLSVKPECLQPTRSFKIRGALNAVAVLAENGTAGHVVAHSSGNHAQGVAYAARRFGLKATVVLPETAPAVKVDAVRGLGVDVVIVPPAERESAALAIAAEYGAVLISSDDHDVIAGAGTTGLEIIADLPDLAAVLVPVCSGSQLSGVAVAAKRINPNIRVIGVEPELAADGVESFRRGTLVAWPLTDTYRTVADGLRAGSMGARAWEHVRRYVDDMVTVTEADILAAAEFLRTATGLIAEPSGAVTTAAYRTYRDMLPAGPVVAVVTGGNVAAGLLTRSNA